MELGSKKVLCLPRLITFTLYLPITILLALAALTLCLPYCHGKMQVVVVPIT